METLLIATRNAHKVGEIQAILGPGYRYLTLADFPDAPEVDEDASTFAGNAAKKAEELARWLAGQGRFEAAEGGGLWVLADDSGLEVDALKGAPGVHSARYAAQGTGKRGNSSTADNNAKLLRELSGHAGAARKGRFRCVLALTAVEAPGGSAGGETRLFEGTCEGAIELGPRGKGGFGYDPLFVPDGYTRTFAELSEGEKNRLSHRGQALARLRAALAGQARGNKKIANPGSSH
jgi:XTP/dITP diphosphohydrolase